MSDPKTPNPNYSPTKQHLLDLLALGDEELNTKAKEIMELLDDKSELLDQADELWDKHQYPDKHMRYVKSANFAECSERYAVSGYAQAVLSFMEHTMHQSNLIQTSLDEIKDYCNISRASARKAVNELIEAGLIATHTPKYGKQAPIFMVNPKVATSGKPKGGSFDNVFADLVYKTHTDEFKAASKALNEFGYDSDEYMQAILNYPLHRFELNKVHNATLSSAYATTRDGDITMFNRIHLMPKDEQKKESAPSDSTDS